MPETSIAEHADARPGEHNVGTHPPIRGRNRVVLPESKTQPMQRRPQAPLGTRVNTAIRAHAPANRRTRCPTRRRGLPGHTFMLSPTESGRCAAGVDTEADYSSQLRDGDVALERQKRPLSDLTLPHDRFCTLLSVRQGKQKKPRICGVFVL